MKPGPKPVISVEQHEEIVNLYLNTNLSMVKIGEIYGTHHCSISRILKQNGISNKTHDPRRRFSEKEEKEICEKYRQGLSSVKLANMFNTAPSSIQNILKRYKIKMRDAKGENNGRWLGGISFEPYCPKFTEEFKERVRDYWSRKCGLCGKTEEEDERKLGVHHINYDKKVCCNTTPPLFIPLCQSCHGKTNHRREYWEEYFTNYIMVWYNEECF